MPHPRDKIAPAPGDEIAPSKCSRHDPGRASPARQTTAHPLGSESPGELIQRPPAAKSLPRQPGCRGWSVGDHRPSRPHAPPGRLCWLGCRLHSLWRYCLDPPEFRPSRLRRRERRLCPTRDHGGLVLCHGSQDVHGEPVRLREIDRHELDAALHGHSFSLTSIEAATGGLRRHARTDKSPRLASIGDVSRTDPLADRRLPPCP